MKITEIPGGVCGGEGGGGWQVPPGMEIAGGGKSKWKVSSDGYGYSLETTQYEHP